MTAWLKLNGEYYPMRVIYSAVLGLWNDDIIAEAKIKAGVCPDCDNDKCMADGVTGLWCPSCDASYLLDTEANNEHENGQGSKSAQS